ncbi:MAG: thioredoxin family protein [Candidatus Nanohaloarchaea archaeon]|nr:thioredoxin family protein [Candidatus Nanohaloarchaea archaeon]
MTDVTVEVFFSPTCPHCPAQKELARAFDEDDVKIKMTNVMKEQDRAQNFGVSTVPTTLIDGPGTDEKIGFTGVMKKTRMQDAIDVARGRLDPDVLEGDSLLDHIGNMLG